MFENVEHGFYHDFIYKIMMYNWLVEQLYLFNQLGVKYAHL